MNDYDVIVVGGGAAGCMAAVMAARSGRKVLLLEALERPAKKILSTGNGRCNLTNLVFDRTCWYTDDPDGLMRVIGSFPPEDLMAFFEEEGILFHDRKGYVYPRTDQASAVEAVLNRMLSESGADLMTGARVDGAERTDGGFIVHIENESFRTENLILTTGGKVKPGCRGEGFGMALSFGHSLAEPLPGLCPLLSDRKRLKPLAGIRCQAKVTLLTERTETASQTGEVQFTADALSGIPVMNLSRIAGAALAAGLTAEVLIDFLPELSPDRVREELERRLAGPQERTLESVFTGLVHPGILRAVLASGGLQNEQKLKKADRAALYRALEGLTAFPMPVTAPAGFDRAQVTAGGVLLSEIDPFSMESRIVPGLYMAGELVNADGICGGYNLQWAFASGRAAGLSAAQRKENH